MLWAIPSVFAKQAKNNLIEKRKHSFHDGSVEEILLHCTICKASIPLLRRLIASGIHLFPSRTEKLSPTAPMVLQMFVGEQVIATFTWKLWTKVQGFFFLLSHLARVLLVIHYVAAISCIAYNCSTKLLPLVAKHSSKLGVSLAYPQHCGRVGHRHFL